jgi:hypothetical protein
MITRWPMGRGDRCLAGQIGGDQIRRPVRVHLPHHQQIKIPGLHGHHIHHRPVHAQILDRAPLGGQRRMRHAGIKTALQPGIAGPPGLAVAAERLGGQVLGVGGQGLGHRQAGQPGPLRLGQRHGGGNMIGLVTIVGEIEQDIAHPWPRGVAMPWSKPTPAGPGRASGISQTPRDG